MPNFYNPMDCNPPSSSIHGIFQDAGVGRLSFPSPGNLPNPRTERRSPALRAVSLPSEPSAKPHLCPAAAASLQSCPTLCDPIDSSPRGSAVPGILQAIVLEWGAIAFSIYALQGVKNIE